jgi:hypothetical protein
VDSGARRTQASEKAQVRQCNSDTRVSVTFASDSGSVFGADICCGSKFMPSECRELKRKTIDLLGHMLREPGSPSARC